jgi:NACalpha-BTF3-like transcription factor
LKKIVALIKILSTIKIYREFHKNLGGAMINSMGSNPISNEHQSGFPQENQTDSGELDEEKVTEQHVEIPDKTTGFTEADVKKLMSQTGVSYAKAKEVLEEREFYIQLVMKKGFSREQAEKQIDSVF